MALFSTSFRYREGLSTALPLLHRTGVSVGLFLIGNSPRCMERGWGKRCYAVHGMSPGIFFWNPASTILEWEREPVLGSGGWGQMMRKIPISLEKCWAESSLENYKSSWSELAVSYV